MGTDVGVPGETQHRSVPAARRPEVVDIAVAEVFDLEARVGEPSGHDFLATLVGGVTELREMRSSVRSTVADIGARYTEAVRPQQAVL